MVLECAITISQNYENQNLSLNDKTQNIFYSFELLYTYK